MHRDYFRIDIKLDPNDFLQALLYYWVREPFKVGLEFTKEQSNIND